MIRAVYQDAAGHRFSGNLEKTADGWRLTHAGNSKTYSQLPFYIEAPDVEGGYVEFVGFDIPDDVHPKRVERGIIVDGAFVPWPLKPESRLPNESSFQQLQRIALDRHAQNHKVQALSRSRLLDELNQPNTRVAQMTQAALQIRNEYAAAMKKTIGEK